MGLLSLAAVLERAGYQPRIIDFNYEIDREAVRLDSSFFESAVRQIIAQEPDVVGFSTMCNSFHITLKLAQLFKTNAPHVPILLGGPQVSYVDEDTLSAFDFVDYVIRGEAEDALPKFVAALQGEGSLASVPGLSFRSTSKVVRNAPAEPIAKLDDLPYRENGLRLWDIYVGWNQHCQCSSLSILAHDRVGSQYTPSLAGVVTEPRAKPTETTDKYILEFVDFIVRYANDRGLVLNERDIHDEILAFYLNHYHDVLVQVTRDRVPGGATKLDGMHREQALCQ